MDESEKSKETDGTEENVGETNDKVGNVEEVGNAEKDGNVEDNLEEAKKRFTKLNEEYINEVTEQKKTKEEFFGWKDIESQYYQVIRDSNRPKWCKIVWYAITIILMCVTIYMVSQLLINYFEYSSYNHVKTKWVHSVVLPAISICSPNLLNYTRLTEQLPAKDVKLLIDLMIDVELMSGDGLNHINMTAYNNLENRTKPDGKRYDIFREFYMNPHDFSVVKEYDYKFAKKFFTLNDEEYYRLTQPHELGWCLQLNDDGKLNQTIAGRNGGFTIDLNTNLEHYLNSTPSSGFVVFIRDSNETVMLADSGYFVEPGKEIFIRVEKSLVARLKQPYGHCINTDNDWRVLGTPGIYKTAQECIEENKIYVMAEYCGCLPWYLIDRIDMLEHDRVGNLTRDLLTKKWAAAIDEKQNISAPGFMLESMVCTFAQQATCDAIVQMKISSNESKHCDHSCHFQQYDVDITESIFPPTRKYFDKVIGPHTDNKTFEYARENFVRLHIFYGELKETYITQVKAYQVQNFIAELGGTMDLLIGLSFFTMFQLFEIVIAYVLFKCWGKKSE